MIVLKEHNIKPFTDVDRVCKLSLGSVGKLVTGRTKSASIENQRNIINYLNSLPDYELHWDVDAVTKRMVELNINNVKLAELIGFKTASPLSKYLSGEVVPNIDIAEAIYSALNLVD